MGDKYGNISLYRKYMRNFVILFIHEVPGIIFVHKTCSIISMGESCIPHLAPSAKGCRFNPKGPMELTPFGRSRFDRLIFDVFFRNSHGLEPSEYNGGSGTLSKRSECSFCWYLQDSCFFGGVPKLFPTPHSPPPPYVRFQGMQRVGKDGGHTTDGEQKTTPGCVFREVVGDFNWMDPESKIWQTLRLPFGPIEFGSESLRLI